MLHTFIKKSNSAGFGRRSMISNHFTYQVMKNSFLNITYAIQKPYKKLKREGFWKVVAVLFYLRTLISYFILCTFAIYTADVHTTYKKLKSVWIASDHPVLSQCKLEKNLPYLLIILVCPGFLYMLLQPVVKKIAKSLILLYYQIVKCEMYHLIGNCVLYTQAGIKKLSGPWETNFKVFITNT